MGNSLLGVGPLARIFAQGEKCGLAERKRAERPAVNARRRGCPHPFVKYGAAIGRPPDVLHGVCRDDRTAPDAPCPRHA